MSNVDMETVKALFRRVFPSEEEVKDVYLIGDYGLAGKMFAAISVHNLLFISLDSNLNEKDKHIFPVDDVQYVEIQGFPYYRTTVFCHGNVTKIDTNANLGEFKNAVMSHIKCKYNSYKEAIKSAEKVSETRYTCNSCGNIWYLSKEEDPSRNPCYCAPCCFSWATGSTRSAIIFNPSTCPKCNSNNVKKEIVAFTKN